VIALRELLMRDAKLLVEYLNDREVQEFMEEFPYPFRVSHAIEMIKRSRDGKREVVRGIVKDDILVGIIGLLEIFRGKGKLFYLVGKEYRGQGIATEAVKIFLEEIRGRIDLVYAFVAQENTASARVLEKNGFKKAGVVRRFIRNSFGEKLDAVLYFREL